MNCAYGGVLAAPAPAAVHRAPWLGAGCRCRVVVTLGNANSRQKTLHHMHDGVWRIDTASIVLQHCFGLRDTSCAAANRHSLAAAHRIWHGACRRAQRAQQQWQAAMLARTPGAHQLCSCHTPARRASGSSCRSAHSLCTPPHSGQSVSAHPHTAQSMTRTTAQRVSSTTAPPMRRCHLSFA
jgi:hypothetical protein